MARSANKRIGDSRHHRGTVSVTEVADILPEAELTPRNVKIRAERVSMGFAVELQIPTSNSELEPGVWRRTGRYNSWPRLV